MHHEHSMGLKNAKELSRGQRGAEAIEVMHCVNENRETGYFCLSPFQFLQTIETTSSPRTVLVAEALAHTSSKKVCTHLTPWCCFPWILTSCYVKPEFAQSFEKQAPDRNISNSGEHRSANKCSPGSWEEQTGNGTSNIHGTAKESSVAKGAAAGACTALSEHFISQCFWTANAVHMPLANLFLANEVSEKQIRLLLTLSLMQPLLCHSQFLKWSYNSAAKNTWCDRLGRWNGLLMSACANGSWAELLKSNKLYRFRAQNNFSYITLMSFVMKTNCFVLYKVVPVGAGKFKMTQGHW